MLEAKYVKWQNGDRAARQERKVGRADKHRARVAEELLKDSPNRRTLTKSLGVLQRMSTHDYVDYADAKLWSAGAGAANNATMIASINKLANGSSGNPLELPAFKRTMLLQIKSSLLDHKPASTPSVSWGQLPHSSKPTPPTPQPARNRPLTASQMEDAAYPEGGSDSPLVEHAQSKASNAPGAKPPVVPVVPVIPLGTEEGGSDESSLSIHRSSNGSPIPGFGSAAAKQRIPGDPNQFRPIPLDDDSLIADGDDSPDLDDEPIHSPSIKRATLTAPEEVDVDVSTDLIEVANDMATDLTAFLKAATAGNEDAAASVAKPVTPELGVQNQSMKPDRTETEKI